MHQLGMMVSKTLVHAVTLKDLISYLLLKDTFCNVHVRLTSLL